MGNAPGLEAGLSPWIEQQRRREGWGNAREMRTLLERAREAQAMHISRTPGANLSNIGMDHLKLAIGAIDG